MFLLLFCIIFQAEKSSIFSKKTKQTNVLAEDKLLPVFQCGFLRSEENVDLHNFQPYDVKCLCVGSIMQW